MFLRLFTIFDISCQSLSQRFWWLRGVLICLFIILLTLHNRALHSYYLPWIHRTKTRTIYRNKRKKCTSNFKGHGWSEKKDNFKRKLYTRKKNPRLVWIRLLKNLRLFINNLASTLTKVGGKMHFAVYIPYLIKKKNRVKNSRKGIEESTILIITDSKSQLTHTISNHSNFKNSML